MMLESTTAVTKLKEAREELRQEWITLQKLGRALTPDEQARSEALDRVIGLINEALKALGEEI